MIRFGVIGTSWITEAFINAGRQHHNFVITSVFSRDVENGEQFAKKNDIPYVFHSLEEMAASQMIDAVYIASPNASHKSQTILFLEHKKHVLCEKSIASNTQELKAMIHAAKENKVLLMEAMKTTFLPNFNQIKSNLFKLGKIRRFFASYCQYSSKYDAYKRGEYVNAFNKDLSNGALMDIGVYCIHPIIHLFGMPDKVNASSIHLASGVDGQGAIILAYPDMDGIIMYSKISQSYIPSEILGENGSMVIDRINGISNVKIYYRDGRVEDITVAQMEETMYYEIEEFMDLIIANQIESSKNSYNNALNVMCIMDEVRQQCQIVFPADQ